MLPAEVFGCLDWSPPEGHGRGHGLFPAGIVSSGHLRPAQPGGGGCFEGCCEGRGLPSLGLTPPLGLSHGRALLVISNLSEDLDFEFCLGRGE